MGALFAKLCHNDRDENGIVKLTADMDPTIWGKLPKVLYDRIADFADIDTRRAMGFPPRKLQFDKNQILVYREDAHDGYESFKYYPERQTIIFFTRLNNFHMYMKVWYNVRYDRDGIYRPVIGDFIECREHSIKNFIHFPRLPISITAD
jgi:hypothetical protein